MKILFYDDSPVFGGHEVMTLLGLEALLEKSDAAVHFIATSASEKLCEKVSALSKKFPQLTHERVDYHSSKLEALRNLLKPTRKRTLAARMLAIKPTLVVAVQGNIEHSSLALEAARLANIPSTSYLPVPHSNEEMGARLGKLRDLACTRLLNAPDSFVTITDEMARMLRTRGAKVPIHIVYNGVDTTRFVPKDKAESRKPLNLPVDKILIGIIGRIEFRQKQQHLLVEAVAADQALKSKIHLVFAGEGPDVEPLKQLLAEKGVTGTVLPWSDPAVLYPALDALVIPSRYEGLPLVMLEAISCETAVLASDRDGMKDILPSEWRFTENDASALSSALSAFIGSGLPRPTADLVAKIRRTMSLESFGESFSSTLLMLAGHPVSRLQREGQKPNI